MEGWSKDNWGIGAIIFIGLFGSLLGVCPVRWFLSLLRPSKTWRDDAILIDGTLLELKEVEQSEMNWSWKEQRIAYCFDLGPALTGVVHVRDWRVSAEISSQLGRAGSPVHIRRHKKEPLLHVLELEAQAAAPAPQIGIWCLWIYNVGCFLAGLGIASGLPLAITEDVQKSLYGAVVFFVSVMPSFPPFGFWHSHVYFVDWYPLLLWPWVWRSWLLRRPIGARGQRLHGHAAARAAAPMELGKAENAEM